MEHNVETAREEVSPYKVAAAWGGVVNDEAGFVALPMSLLRLQGDLTITPTEFGVLANLLAHRWKAGDVVFPRATIIAKRMGVTVRTVQRATNGLTKKGIIRKVKMTNGMRGYDAQPLVDKLVAMSSSATGARLREIKGA